MVKTFIYGTPHGFNFYEGDATWDSYFKGFYVSSRKGQRLMINRREDRTVVYSFLCYSLMEYADSPRPNAFFGCSLVVDDTMFSPDLKTMFKWFSFLFDTLIQRGKLFYKNEGGRIQYRCERFADCQEEVAWLKENMPNIFNSNDIRKFQPDQYFSSDNSGRVICSHIDTAEEKLLANIKKSRWVAISPLFKPDEEIEEINFAEIEKKYNQFNERLVEYMLSSSQQTIQQLDSLGKDCKQTIGLLRKYQGVVEDDTEKQNCQTYINKYSSLFEKIEQGRNNKFQSKKGRNYPPQDSSTQSTTQTVYPPQPIHDSKQGPLPPAYPPNQQHTSNDNFGNIYMIIAAVVVVAFIGITAYLILGGDDEVTTTPTEQFAQSEFYAFLESGRFNDAVEYTQKYSRVDLNVQIRDAMIKEIAQILDKTQNPDEDIQQFIDDNQVAIDHIGLSNKIEMIQRSYQAISETIKKANLSEAEIQYAMHSLENLPDCALKNRFRTELGSRLQQLITDAQRRSDDRHQQSQSAVTIIVSYTWNGEPNTESFTSSRSIYIPCKGNEPTQIEVRTSPETKMTFSGSVNHNPKRTRCTADIKDGTTQTFTCNGIKVKVTGKKSDPKMTHV